MDSVEHKRERHVLIVEDSPDLQHLIGHIFAIVGYRVSRAFDGKEALNLLRSTIDLPSLILLDLMLPIMDGFEFRQEQMKDPRLALVPVVIMTADVNAISKAKGLGVVDVVSKHELDLDILMKIAARFGETV